MSEGSPLSRVIRRLDLSATPPRTDPNDRRVFFDAKALVQLEKPPLFTFGKDVRQYLVSVRKPVQCRGPVCRLKSAQAGLSFDVEIGYEAFCEPGNEGRVVAALHRTDPPALALEQLIAGLVQDFVADCKQNGRDACLDFPRLRRELADSIARRVRDDVGLTLEDVEIRPTHAGKLEPVALQKTRFPVRLSDCDEEVDVELTARLDVDPDNQGLALARLPETAGLEMVVKRAVREAAGGETLHALAFESTGRLRSRWTEAINRRLRDEGRRISHLQIDQKLSPPPLEPREIYHAVESPIGNMTEKFRIEHRVWLNLIDFGRFHSAAVASLEGWAQAKLTRITRSVLFDQRYVDVLLDFESGASRIVGEIKAAMERDAAEIGYGIRQLVVIPNLEPLEWRKGFTVEDKTSYATSDTRVEIRLNIVVSGKISHLQDPRLSRFLTPHSKIFDEMKEVARREAQQILHGVDPARCYMRFNRSDIAGEAPVKEMLEERVGKVVAERFAVDEVRVFAKPLETELTRRLAALQERPHVLDVKSFPLRSGGRREEVTFRIIFNVAGVHARGWHVFRAKCLGTPEEAREIPQLRSQAEMPQLAGEVAGSARQLDQIIGQIKEILREDVRGLLDTIPSEYLQYSDIQVKRQIEGILDSAVGKVTETFGLVISIVSMRREATLGESAESAVLAEDIEVNRGSAMEAARNTSKAKLEQLAELEEIERGLLTAESGVDDEALQKVRRNIKALRNDLLAYPTKADKQHVKPLPQGEEAGFSFEQYGPAALGPGGAPPKQMTEGAEEG